MRHISLSVLLIEDSPTDARLVQEAFAAVPAGVFVLTHVERLSTGLKRLSEARFDAMLLDLGLPDSQGLETLIKLRIQAQEIPVIVLMSLADEALAVAALQEGAEDYLLKEQVAGSMLVRALRYAIERKRAEKLLRTSEERFRGVFEGAPDAMVVINGAGRIVLVNAQTEVLFGYARAEILGQPVECLIPERFWTSHVAYRRRYVENPHVRPMGGGLDIYGRRKDGSEFPVAINLSPLETAEGIFIVSAIRDNTARQQAELMQAYLAAIVDSSEDAVIGKTLDGIITSWNAGAQRMYGYTAAEVCGRSITLLMPPESPEEIASILTRIRRGEYIAPYETVRMRKDGSRIDISLTVSPIHDAAGRLVGASAIARDITAQKRAAKALREQREWLTVTLSSIGDGIIATDTTGTITFLNPIAAQLTGWPAAEALGRPVAEVLQLLSEQTRQPVDNPALGVLHAGWAVELPRHTVLRTRDGREVAVADSAAPIRTADGDLLGAVLVFRDVSAQRQMEEELLRARKIESVGVLAGGIAHDFNNLLTGILGNISLAKLLVSGDAKAVTRLTEAEKACQRATALTQQLLTFAKGGAPVLQTVSLTQLLTESVTFALRGTRVCGNLRVADDLWPVDADTGQMSQVFQNVVLNAVQAMPEGGTVEVRADNVVLGADSSLPLPEGRYIKIVMQDHGCGIPRDVLPKIFDPYFTTKARGSGLGLTTAYTIVAKHDGYIGVDSEMGGGTTVVIYLPASRQTVAPAPVSPTVPLVGHGRILVMDDEDIICDLLREFLTSLGYEVECVRDGRAAIAAYQQAQAAGQPFAAAILDSTIPGGMGGRETIAHLRTLNPQVVALLSSGYANDPMMANPAQYGFRGIIAKPYTVEKLQETLRCVLQEGPGTP
jgi:PAS domain S-box-containing protein